jgi:hypothetical protein
MMGSELRRRALSWPVGATHACDHYDADRRVHPVVHGILADEFDLILPKCLIRLGVVAERTGMISKAGKELKNPAPLRAGFR